jgi:hypothetical protein
VLGLSISGASGEKEQETEHSIPIDQFEPVFGFRTNELLNFEHTAAAAVAHGDIPVRGCREVASVHLDVDGTRRFDVFAAGLGSSG